MRILVRAKEPVLKERRHQRHGYHTAGKYFLVISYTRTDMHPTPLLFQQILLILALVLPSAPRSSIRSRRNHMARSSPILGTDRLSRIPAQSRTRIHQRRCRRRRSIRRGGQTNFTRGRRNHNAGDGGDDVRSCREGCGGIMLRCF